MVESYEKTAHYVTSQVASKKTVIGTFALGTNILKTRNPDLYFEMNEKADGLYQTAITGLEPYQTKRTERLDLVIGSGGKGQGYLFWKGSQLFQLPVGYSNVFHEWINSPGYRDGTANFDRPIIPRCLECHAGYFESLDHKPPDNRYNKTNFVIGITCERCHGPGRTHIDQEKNGVAKPVDAAIVNPTKLSAVRSFEVCGQCHGGLGVRSVAPAFTYLPGQPLDQFLDFGPVDENAEIDVHGKQVMLLKKSRCYVASQNMSCSTCHDVHKQEVSMAEYSKECLTCHKIETCGEFAKKGHAIAENCIDCHMPNLKSKTVFLSVNGKSVNPEFRTHWIKVYSENPQEK